MYRVFYKVDKLDWTAAIRLLPAHVGPCDSDLSIALENYAAPISRNNTSLEPYRNPARAKTVYRRQSHRGLLLLSLNSFVGLRPVRQFDPLPLGGAGFHTCPMLRHLYCPAFAFLGQ